MPGEMDGYSSTFAPCRFSRSKKCEPVIDTALHFHHMRDDMNGARMTGIKCQRAPRDFFGKAVLSILLEGKSVHRKDARITRHLGHPVRQHLRDPVAHHAPPAEVEVERVRDRKRQNVMRPVDQDGPVKCDCMCRIAVAAKACRRTGSPASGHAASIAAMLAVSAEREAALSARTISAARRQ